ncbi:unnamed protein product [Schistosoma haematobium]|nr:unnamed protein product [Schistosoma haematobium]
MKYDNERGENIYIYIQEKTRKKSQCLKKIKNKAMIYKKSQKGTDSQLQLGVPDHVGFTNDDVTGIQCLTTLLPVTPSNIFRSHQEKSKDRVEEIGRVYLAMTNISEFSDLIWLAIAVDVEHGVTTRDLVQMPD